MEIALLVARVLLAVVFVVAGLAKLADRTGSRQAVVDFGVPAWLAAPLGVLLPLAELAVAVVLIPRAAAWYGAVGALVLLLVFVAGISLSLARGRRPDCHCFGQLSSAPVGWSTLARNGVLAAIAGLLVWHGQTDVGPSAVRWLGNVTLAQWAGVIGGTIVLGLLAAQGWGLLQLLRQNGRLLLRLEAVEAHLGIIHTGAAAGLPVGAPAPRFRLPSLDGDALTLDALCAAGKPVLLMFANPGCGPCTTLLPDIGRWQREHAARMTVALISRGTPEANRAKVAEHRLTHVLLQRDVEVLQAYQVDGTPSAVLVRPDGTIGSPLATGPDAIRALVARAARLPVPLPLAANGGRSNGRQPRLRQRVPPSAIRPPRSRSPISAVRPSTWPTSGAAQPSCSSGAEPPLRLLSADAPRPEGLGGPSAGGGAHAPGGVDGYSRREPGPGPACAGGAGPGFRRDERVRRERHTDGRAGRRPRPDCLGGSRGRPGGPSAGQGRARPG